MEEAPVPPPKQSPWDGFHLIAKREGAGAARSGRTSPGWGQFSALCRGNEATSSRGRGSASGGMEKLQVPEPEPGGAARGGSGTGRSPGAERSSLLGVRRRASILGAAGWIGNSCSAANPRERVAGGRGISPAPAPPPRGLDHPLSLSAAQRARGEPSPPPKTAPWDAHGGGGEITQLSSRPAAAMTTPEVSFQLTPPAPRATTALRGGGGSIAGTR